MGLTNYIFKIGIGGNSVPDFFDFQDQFDVGIDALIISEPLEILGLTTGAVITVSGTGGSPKYDINLSGNFTSSPGIINNEDLVRAQFQSSPNGNTELLATIIIGGVLDNFRATTIAAGDTIAPILSLPTGIKTGVTTASGTITTDEGNGTLWCYISQNSSETATTIKASGSSKAVTAIGLINAIFSGLTANTLYYIHYVQDDASNNESNVENSAGFTTDIVDVTAPILTLPAGASTGSTTGSGSVTTDTPEGTIWFIVTENPTESVGTIKAGNNQTVIGTSIVVIFTGLTPWTVYYTHFVQDDIAGNTSVVANSLGAFTTDAPVNNPNIIYESNFVNDGAFLADHVGNGFDNAPEGFDNTKAAGGIIKGVPGAGINGSVALKFEWDAGTGQVLAVGMRKHLTGDKNTGYNEIFIRFRVRLPDTFVAGDSDPSPALTFWKHLRLWQGVDIPANAPNPSEGEIGDPSFYIVANFNGRPGFGTAQGCVMSENDSDHAGNSSDGGRYNLDLYQGSFNNTRGTHIGKPLHWDNMANGAWEFNDISRKLYSAEDNPSNIRAKNHNYTTTPYSDDPLAQTYHTLEWHFKLSTGNHTFDGLRESFFDGVAQVPNLDIKRKAGPTTNLPFFPSGGTNDMVPHGVETLPTADKGGFNYITVFDNLADWSEHWEDSLVEGGIYMNDIVISTSRIGHTYNVGDSSSIILAANIGAFTITGIDDTLISSSTTPITGITFTWSTHRREAESSDNFPITWSTNDNQYTSGGDGNQWDGVSTRGRLWYAEIDGTKDNYTGTMQYTKPEPSAGDATGKTYGMLALGNAIYNWIAPNSGNTNFTKQTLYKSTDDCVSWITTGIILEDSDFNLCPPTILNYGKDYNGNVDGYIYHYAADIKDTGTTLPIQKDGTNGEIWLFRCLIADIEIFANYEWFTGTAETPTWGTYANRKAVITDTDGVSWNTGSCNWVPGLNRYLFATEHTASKVGNLKIREAPNPWGPWTVIHNETNWPQDSTGSFDDPVEQTGFYWTFAPKWWDQNGNGVMLASGISSMDSWNSIEISLTT